MRTILPHGARASLCLAIALFVALVAAPMRRARSENQAPRRKGMPANHNTGTERIQLPQFSNCRRSSLNSPGAAT